MSSKSFVYDTVKEIFTEFSGFDVNASSVISGVTTENILCLITDLDGTLKLYPGSSRTAAAAQCRTKRFLLNGGKVTKVRCQFEGILTLKVRIYNTRIPTGWVEQTITNLTSGVWRGLQRGMRGDFVEFAFEGAEAIDWLDYEVE